MKKMFRKRIEYGKHIVLLILLHTQPTLNEKLAHKLVLHKRVASH